MVTCAGGASICKTNLNSPGNPRKLQGTGDVTALTDAILIFLRLKRPTNYSDDTSDATIKIIRLHTFQNLLKSLIKMKFDFIKPSLF